MDLNGVVDAFHSRPSQIPRAVEVLLHGRAPLPQRDVERLLAYSKERQEQIDAGVAVESVPEAMEVLLRRPVEAISTLAAVQCVLMAARLPYFPRRSMRRLNKVLLPAVCREAALPLGAWAVVLAQCQRSLPIHTSKAAVRTAEQLLALAADAVFAPATAAGRHHDPHAAVAGAGAVSEREAARLPPTTVEALRTEWMKVAAKVARRRAAAHADAAKHSRQTAATRSRATLYGSKPMQRLQRVLARVDRAVVLAALQALSRPAVAVADVFALYVLCQHACGADVAVPKELATQATKAAPVAVWEALGGDRQPVRGVCVSDPDDVIVFCLYHLGLTTTTVPMARAMLAMIDALPADVTRAYVAAKGAEAVLQQLLHPFTNNAKVFVPEVAVGLQGVYGRLLGGTLQAGPVPLPHLMRCGASFVLNKCRAAQEKASVLRVLEAASPRAAVEAGGGAWDAAVSAMLQREMLSPAADCAAAAWRLVELLDLLPLVEDAVLAHVKQIDGSPELRRVVLQHLAASAPPRVVAPLVGGLLEDCAEVETVRADAYLALLPAAAALPLQDVVRASKHVCTAEVLAQFHGTALLGRVAATAIALANVGIYDAVAVLLTHPSGAVRLALGDFVASVKAEASVLVSLWDSITRTVFGMGAPTTTNAAATTTTTTPTPRMLSASAAHAVRRVAEPLLASHTAKIAVGSVVAEVVLCCGHDHVQGADPLFLHANRATTGRYRGSSARVDTTLFLALFHNRAHLLAPHADAVAHQLVETMRRADVAPHLGVAAARGVALLLAVAPESGVPAILRRLLAALETSAAYFQQLDDLDVAIAADAAEAVLAYETATLTAMGVMKTYPEKPPKGTSEEEYEALKKREAEALRRAREALRETVATRRGQILGQVEAHKLLFAAVRTMGTTGGFPPEAVAVLYPPLQALLNEEATPLALRVAAHDAVAGLLASTPFARVREVLPATIAALWNTVGLTAEDVRRLSTLVQMLRQTMTSMVEAPVFVVLVAFATVAFKAGKSGRTVHTIPVATQHQLLGLVIQNLGQKNLPQPRATLELMSNILRSFPALYKSIQQGMNMLMSAIPAASLDALENCLLNGTDGVKEVTATAFHRFADFDACRRALVLAACLAHDDAATVAHAMASILAERHVVVGVDDWGDLRYLLAQYGGRRVSALRIAKVIRELFATPAHRDLQGKWLADLRGIGGVGAVVTLHTLSVTLHPASVTEAMLYLCELAANPATPEAQMQLILSAGRAILSDCDLEHLRTTAPMLQARLQALPKDCTAAHKEQYLAISTVWSTTIAARLRETTLLEAIVDQLLAIMGSSQSMMVHRFVCDAMAEITTSDAIRASAKVDEFVEKALKQAIHSGSYVRKKAHAWGLAGACKGLGIVSIRRYNLVNVLSDAAKEKQTERSGVMVIVEVMCDALGRLFEPYALVLSPLLLEAVAEKDVKVSECADDASKAMMRCLSSVGLRQLIPRLVDGLSHEQTKKRIPPLSFIGYVAYSSPKQLAATLPEITKHITSCLFDVNSLVSSAAYVALKRVAGVVSNPEIKEHVELILNAMRSPSTDTEGALDALLYTRFVNVVDPASLALIVPVISRGLSSQMNTKAKAAQIVASMSDLVSDPHSLVPYAHDLVELLKAAAQDPQAEVRTTSAKAISSLTAAIAGTMYVDIGDWCMSVLQRANTSAVEKAGAAQVFVELVSACGSAVLDHYFREVEAGMLHEKPSVREGYLHIMVFAPSTMPAEIFQSFLYTAFPWVLDGLSHLNEKVRDVALLAGTGIIALHGTRNLPLVVEPLLAGVRSEINTLRHSSLILASKLLIHLVVHIKRKMRIQDTASGAAEVEGGSADAGDVAQSYTEGGAIQVEAARDAEKRGVSILGALEELLGTEKFTVLLAAIHMGRSEHNATVRTDVSSAWQVCVASPRGALSKIFESLVSILVKFGASENPECRDVAARSIEYTCTRLNETIERFVDVLAERYKENSRDVKLGSLFALTNVAQFADAARLKAMGGQIIACVLPGIQHEDPEIQAYAGTLLDRVTKAVGSRLIESIVESQIDTSVRGVVEVVKVRPQASLAVIVKQLLARTTYTIPNLELIDVILQLEETEAELPKYLESMVTILFSCLVQGLEGAGDVLQTLVRGLEEEYLGVPMDYFTKAMKQPATQLGALRATVCYGHSIPVTCTSGLEAVYRIVIDALGNPDEAIRAEAVAAIPELNSSIDQRVVDDLEEEERQDITTAKRAAGRFSLQFLDVFQTTLALTARATITSDEPEFAILGEGTNPRLFDALMTFYNRGLDYGTPMQKVQAVECIQDLLSFAPRSISASATNTIAGRCSKVLFVRNEGAVVLALVQLCLQLMSYPASGKEKMVEGTMALAMFNAALCDSGEARVLALHVVITLLRRSEKYADLILGTVVTKKNSVDSPLLRGVLCRFVSVVIRYSNFTKALGHVTKLLEIIRPIWEAAETPATAAAAGCAMGTLCKSASATDDVVRELMDKALQMLLSKGNQSLAGFAFAYGLVTSAQDRVSAVDGGFLDAAVARVQTAASYGASVKITNAWILRAGAALAAAGARGFKLEPFLPLLRRVTAADETLLSTAEYFYSCVAGLDAENEAKLESIAREQSRQWATQGQFDADLDDEVIADTVL